MEHVDALLDCSRFCLVDTEVQLLHILQFLKSKRTTQKNHISQKCNGNVTVFVLNKIYNDTKYRASIGTILTTFSSVLPITTVAQFGEISAKCALQSRDSSLRDCKVQNLQTSCTSILSTVQMIPGLGPKQAKKTMEKFGSLFNLTNATLADLECVLGKVTAMSVYQFLH